MIRLVRISAGLTLLAIVVATTAVAGAQDSDRAAANLQTEIFVVENMTCGLCPITVRKAMIGVEGVKSVAIDFEEKTATVVFDGSVTDTEAVAKASGEAGYPAQPGGRRFP